jgi:hypothetical protein
MQMLHGLQGLIQTVSRHGQSRWQRQRGCSRH